MITCTGDLQGDMIKPNRGEMIMSYINVGAVGATGLPIRTKKALKAALSQDLRSVRFYSTSPMGPQHDGTLPDLTPGVVLIVCGPNPETDRTWWANVKIDESGQAYWGEGTRWTKIKPAA